MVWYAAHLIEYFKQKTQEQETYRVYENVVLIQAASIEEAFTEANRIGRLEYGQPDDSLMIDDQPAIAIFAGIRKLVECADTIASPSSTDADLDPGHGTEITYTTLLVDSEEAVRKLARGDEVAVTFQKIRSSKLSQRDDASDEA